ncbi:hypothetical protein DFH06DRAFT_1480451 [Mycena polygramma]|nr:hypothetical protein DFH06DRAFT_1480451 [Mycena polygramma]
MPPTIAMPHPAYGIYPPLAPSESPPQIFDASSSTNLKPTQSAAGARPISRTPSPTPTEYNYLHGIRKKKTTQERIKLYAILAAFIALAVLISIYTQKIVHALTPATNWLHDHNFGFLIPIALLVVLSFPPLFGGEIVATLVGVTWNLPAAFGIVAAGTLLGEIVNFFAFKYACAGRGAKLEANNLGYGALAYIIRQSGFWVVLVIRYSTIPPHFATAVFATVGISFWTFLAAAILSLPNHIVTVYLGYVLKPSVQDDGKSKTIENVLLAAKIVVSMAAYIWIQRKFKAAKPDFIYGRRKARQANGNEEVSLNRNMNEPY